MNRFPTLHPPPLQISLLALQQSYKLFQFLESYVPPNNAPAQRYSLLVKWAIYDIVTICIVIPHLRIPRLEWPAKNRAILIAILLSLNWVVAGDWKLLSLLKATSILLPSSLTSGLRCAYSAAGFLS